MAITKNHKTRVTYWQLRVTCSPYLIFVNNGDITEMELELRCISNRIRDMGASFLDSREGARLTSPMRSLLCAMDYGDMASYSIRKHKITDIDWASKLVQCGSRNEVH